MEVSPTQNRKVPSRLKAQLTKFAAEFSQGLSEPLRRFVGETLFGIQASRVVKLSPIARSLDETIPLIETEDRLWRNLKAKELEDHLSERLVEMGSRRVEQSTVLCPELSDVRKEYAKKMEHLDEVWDGSEGEVHQGYWLWSVTAAEAEASEITPLGEKLFSARAKNFVSENAEILECADQIRAHTRGRGIWAVDRDGDRKKLLEPLLERREHFVISLDGPAVWCSIGRSRGRRFTPWAHAAGCAIRRA